MKKVKGKGMKKRILAILAAITIAGSSIGVGGTGYAAESDYFEGPQDVILDSETCEIEVTIEDSEEGSSAEGDSAKEAASDPDQDIITEEIEDNEDNAYADSSEDAGESSEAAGTEDDPVVSEGSSADEGSSVDEGILAVEGSSADETEDEAAEDVILEETDEASFGESVEATDVSENSTDAFVKVTAGQKGKWINKKGKWTYENADGRFADDDGKALDNNVAHIGDEYYYFKGRYMATGFVYFDHYGSAVSKSKANYAVYCDKTTGAIQKGFFIVGDNSYLAIKNEKGYGIIRFDRIVTDEESANASYYLDKDGAIVKDKFFSYEGSKYRAGADGKLLTDGTYLIDGKFYNFDSEGRLVTTGMRSGYYYINADNVRAQAYIRARGPRNPAAGYSYYTDAECKKVLTNTWLYSAGGSKVYYLDRFGEAATGIVKAGEETILFDKSTARINAVTGVYKEGSKYYYVIKGIVVTTPGFYKIDSFVYYYVTGTSGELATGFRTIKTEKYPEGKKYHFKEAGSSRVAQLDYYRAEVNGKLYHINQKNYNEKYPFGPEDYFVCSYKECKEQQKADEGFIPADTEFNSDGSYFTGWKTIKRQKYYYYQGHKAEAGRIYGTAKGRPYVMDIDGKLYLMAPEGYQMSGWYRIKKSENIPVYPFDRTSPWQMSEDFYMYFSETDGKAAVGFKAVPAPTLDESGNIALDKDGNVIVSGEKKRLLFATKADDNYMKGALVRNASYVLNGRKYLLDGAGCAYKLPEGPAKKDGGTVYQKADGSYKTGAIDGCYYDPATGYMLTNVFRKTGKKWYYYGADGKQSSDSLQVTLGSGRKAFAVFNKDGSIKNFVDKDGAKIKDVYFIFNSSAYFIGSKGTLLTGRIELAYFKNGDSTIVYVENDGKTDFQVPSIGSDAAMIKDGKKIYVISEGQIVTDDSKEYRVVDYSRLPEADRYAMDRYREEFMNNSYKYIPVHVGADGSVSAKTTNYYGRTLHLNSYGIPLEYMCAFRKSGKNWYVNDVDCAGTASLDLIISNPYTLDTEYRTAKVSWDHNGKMSEIFDASTGKAISGYVTIREINIGKDTRSVNYNMKLKKGYPYTGSVSVSTKALATRYGVKNLKIKYTFDPDTGLLDAAAANREMERLGIDL